MTVKPTGGTPLKSTAIRGVNAFRKTEEEFKQKMNFIEDDINEIEQEIGGTICCEEKSCQKCDENGIIWWK